MNGLETHLKIHIYENTVNTPYLLYKIMLITGTTKFDATWPPSGVSIKFQRMCNPLSNMCHS
jgi:hypothetical protein